MPRIVKLFGPAPKGPSIIQEATNLADALSNWAKAGFPVADEERIKAIQAICQSCPQWDGSARVGLGKCNSVKCGCTKFKWWLKTSKCPENKW